MSAGLVGIVAAAALTLALGATVEAGAMHHQLAGGPAFADDQGPT